MEVFMAKKPGTKAAGTGLLGGIIRSFRCGYICHNCHKANLLPSHRTFPDVADFQERLVTNPDEKQSCCRSDNPPANPTPGPKTFAYDRNVDLPKRASDKSTSEETNHLIKEAVAIELDCDAGTFPHHIDPMDCSNGCLLGF